MKASKSKTSWINVKKDTAKHNVRAFLSLLDIGKDTIPHHDKKGKNPNMKKKLL